MKKNSLADSILYFLAKALSKGLCCLPLSFCLWLGRRIGDFAFLFLRKRGEVAYLNLKSCLGEAYSPSGLLRLERRVFQNLMQTSVEILRFPLLNKETLDRYTVFRGLERLETSRKRGKGTIALTAHFGNWELQSVGAAMHGFPEHVIARQQKFPKTNSLLNGYRELTGCKVIHKGFMIREVVRHLEANGLVGILTDQDAGKNGVFINFFGRPTSFAPGAISFALRTGCDVIPCFIRREGHAFHTVEITEPLKITKTDNEEEDIRHGLQQFATRLEEFIRNYPDQWLWLHKRWKSTPTRKAAILSDGKAGHLNQSLGVFSSLEKIAAEKKFELMKPDLLEVRYKSGWHRGWASLLSAQANRSCQGCLKCLKFALTRESYQKLTHSKYDFVVSAGSGLAPINRILSMDHHAKSVVVMDPVVPPASSFDLAVIPRHDHPPDGAHVVATVGAPHPLTPPKVRDEAKRLSERIGKPVSPCVGVLIGGDTDEFHFNQKEFSALIEAVALTAKKFGLDILATTSRRSSKEVESLFEKSWGKGDLCRLLVIANRKNLDGVVPGILGLSKIVVVTGESISMVSEAASMAEQVIVFLPKERKQNSKLEEMLVRLAAENQILLTGTEGLPGALEKAFLSKQPRPKLNDAERIEEALRRVV